MNTKIETMNIAKMSDEELLERFDLYNDLKCIDVKTTVIIELMEQEINRREKSNTYA